jgi:hypothetical protein
VRRATGSARDTLARDHRMSTETKLAPRTLNRAAPTAARSCSTQGRDRSAKANPAE